MESIIKQVIESEYRAQEIIDEVENERKQAAFNINMEIERLKDDIFSSARQQAEKIETEKKRQAEAEASRIIKEAKEKALSMQQKLNSNKDFWIDCLFKKIIGQG